MGRALRGRWLAVAASALAAGVAGCNLVTGSSDLVLGSDGEGAGSGTGGSGNTGTGGTGNTGTGGTGNNGTGGTGQGGQAPGCPPCGANEHCESSTLSCVCDPGFLDQGGVCTPAPVGDPTTHTQQEVCDKWNTGHVVTSPSPLVTSGADCDAGSLVQAALDDTLVRINMFRWLLGLGPTSDDPGLNANAQLCANLESWWAWPPGESPHFPPSSSKCYTATGGATAGQSNIAWGSGHPAQAIDQFMEDGGNETTMGHRRWILNPPLGPVGIGYWEGGGQYGNAECLAVFGSSGGGPNPPWVAHPNPGYTPLTMAQWTWTFHGSLSGIPSAQVSMLRVDDNTPLAVTVQTLSQGYGQDCISWRPSGWTPQAGMTYRVTISGLGGGDVVYDVKPVGC
ncbi:MAG: CAP domain-containing protein [Polyangiaceae bacterium]|nr:CAP domain-containing protein [Polyangiaceae bacterium]